MEMVEIEKIINFTCKVLNCTELIRNGKIIVEFANFNHYGDAEYNRNYGHIRLSLRHWVKLTNKQKTEIIIHEVCHVIADYKYGRRKRYKPHGKEWKTLMKCMGFPKPEALIED